MTNMHDDPLEDLFNAAAAGNVRPAAPREASPVSNVVPLRNTFEENCKACRGTGNFRSWNGRLVGPCFKCKGKGKVEFKTDAFTRANNRAKAAVKKVVRAEAVAADALAAYERDHPEVFAWLNSGNDFATSLLGSLKKWGSLTDKQLAAAYRAVEKNAARVAERTAREAAAPVVGNALWEAFEKAKALQAARAESEAGKRRKPSLKFANFTIKEAAKYPGTLYLVTKDDSYLGKVTGGKLYRSRECSDETAALVMELMADPRAAAIKYGERFSFCCICGRGLTNHKSIERVMGPVCASKWGWE